MIILILWCFAFVNTVKFRKIPKKITSGTYFSKAFFEALIFWGTYKFGGKFVLEIYVSKSIGLSYSSDSWKEICVSSLQKIFTETRLEDVHISKTQPFQCFACVDLAKSEEWTTKTAINCDTFWLQSFGTRNSSLACKYKYFCVTVPFLLCFTLYLRGISKYKPPGAYIWSGDLTEGFLRYKFGGLIFGRAYFRNFTVCWVLCNVL